MFKTTLNYSVNTDKNQISVSPTAGTILRWTMYCIAPTVLMVVGFWLADEILDGKTDVSIADELDKALSEEEQK